MKNQLDSFYKNKRILITGNSGFKGCWLTIILKEFGANVMGISIAEVSKPNMFNLLKLDKIMTEKFNYDFTKISKNNFNGSPFSYFKPKAVNINFSHSTEQQKLFSSYIRQFGSSMSGLGTILSRSPVNYFYRNIEIYDN